MAPRSIKGTIITRVRGKAFNQDKLAFDQSDLRYPEIEPYGAFIMTKETIMSDQKVGECVDFDKPCDVQGDCRQGGTPLGDHHKGECFCKVPLDQGVISQLEAAK
jgi:hypothetical protein